MLIYAADSAQARGIEPPFRLVFEQAMGGEIVGRWRLMTMAGNLNLPIFSPHTARHRCTSSVTETRPSRRFDIFGKRFEGPICATSAFYTSQIVEDNPELVEGVYFPQPAFDIQSEAQLTQDFVNAYKQKFQDDPDIYAAHAFDAMRVATFVAREAKSFSPVEIRKILAFGLKEFPGVTGIIQFNDYGDVHHNPIMFIVKDGHVINYERYVEEEKAKIREKIKNLLKG